MLLFVFSSAIYCKPKCGRKLDMDPPRLCRDGRKQRDHITFVLTSEEHELLQTNLHPCVRHGISSFFVINPVLRKGTKWPRQHYFDNIEISKPAMTIPLEQ